MIFNSLCFNKSSTTFLTLTEIFNNFYNKIQQIRGLTDKKLLKIEFLIYQQYKQT